MPHDLITAANLLHPATPDRYSLRTRTRADGSTQWYFYDALNKRAGGYSATEGEAAQAALGSATRSAGMLRAYAEGRKQPATAKANSARRDAEGRESRAHRILARSEVHEWLRGLSPEEIGRILTAEMQRKQ